MTKVFIDGSAGTTGLRIYERLRDRKEIELLIPDDAHRKEESVIREYLNKADVAILCLPDNAAREAVAMTENPDTVIIDTSTAHRVAEGWTYGFPELTGLREQIIASKRIANPGCHASGFIALVSPLVEAGVLKKSAHLSAFSLTGYSGGGKKMIADYDAPENAEAYQAPRMYGLSQSHKHLPEMQKLCGIDRAPVFCPIVSSYYAGMEVTVPLYPDDVSASMDEIKAIYAGRYNGKIVRFSDAADENGFLSAGRYAGSDALEVSVHGNEDRIILTARYDNLGKGASGAAVQNLNLVIGADETAGLVL